jgi:DNA-binding response OmpR family regulator
VCRKCILVVDDDQGIREMIQFVLDDEGYEVFTAPDGARALDQLDHISPDVILLDMKMPDMDGWEFSRRYQERSNNQVPIVVLTAARDAGVWAAAIAAAGYLAKPFEIDDLLRVVQEHAR